jgi:S-adenosylhomocysteine hydrolase
MRQKIPSLIISALVALSMAGGKELRAQMTQRGGSRLHLKDIALKLSPINHPIHGYFLNFYQYFHQPAVKTGPVPPLSAHPSDFENSMRELWKPSDLIGQGPFFSRKGPFPQPTPWMEAVHTKGQFFESDYLKGTVINILARWADQDGWIDLKNLEGKFGQNRLEQDILTMIKSPKKPNLTSVNWNHVYSYLDKTAARKVTARIEQRLVPKDMPALKWVSQLYNPRNRLSTIRRVWAKQHILGNTLGFLQETGITADRMQVWGKVYSLDPRVAAQMLQEGYHVHGDSIPRSRRLLEGQVARELRLIDHPEQYQKPIFLLLDDGGELIETVANYVQKNFPQHAHLFAAVEQTQGGINRLQHKKLPFFVVASGSSWGKREYGSPMFGYAVGKAATRIIDQYQVLFDRLGGKPRQVTVLGYGNIGKYVASYFKGQGFQVMVYDKDPQKRAQAKADGLLTSSRKATALAHGYYLVSCVGRVSLRHSSFWKLPSGAAIFNGGSVNELPRKGDPIGLPTLTSERYREAKNSFRNLLLPNPKDPRDLKMKNLFFAKDGGVINFPLDVQDPHAGNLIPGRYIQFQLGLLYLDLLHAAEGNKPGFGETPIAQQKDLAAFVESRLQKRGESLHQPRWD